MTRVFVIGATSAIASAVLRKYAEDGAALFLAARSLERMDGLAASLRSLGAARVETAPFDAADFASHGPLVAAAFDSLGGVDRVLIAHGSLPDQTACELSAAEAIREFEINATSVISLATVVAGRLERQDSGCLAVIGSVAGDRGRQSNYVYGAAKGAVDIFLGGLRNRLHGTGVRVLTIKPGLVRTRMTSGVKQNLLFAEPDRVGAAIHRAMKAGGGVLYTPWFWRWIMLVVRALPDRVFNRLRL